MSKHFKEYIFNGTILDFATHLEIYVDHQWGVVSTPSGPGPRPDVFERTFPETNNLTEQMRKAKFSFRNLPKDIVKAEFKFYNYGYGGPEGEGRIVASRLPNDKTLLHISTTKYFYGPEAEEPIYAIWHRFQHELERVGLLETNSDERRQISTPKHDKQTWNVGKFESLARLNDIIRSRYDESDLRNLYLALGVQYGSLTSGGTNDQTRALVECCHRNHELEFLLRKITEMRPDIVFDDNLLEGLGVKGFVKTS